MDPPFSIRTETGAVPLSDALSLYRLVVGAWSERKIIAWLCVVAILFGTLLILFRAPSFTARAIIRVNSTDQGTSNSRPPIASQLPTEATEATNLLQSEALAHQAVIRLGLDKLQQRSRLAPLISRWRTSRWNTLLPIQYAEPTSEDAATERLLANLMIKNDPRSNYITVAFTAPSPAEAARVANAVAAEYIHVQRLQKLAARAEFAGNAIADQSAGAAVSEHLVSEERLRVLTAERKLLLVRKARLEAQRDGAKTIEAALGAIQEQDPDTEKLVKQERNIFKAETSDLEKQENTIRSLKPQLLLESEAIDGQITSETRHIELVRHRITEYSKRVEKGLGRSSSMIELQLGEANKQSNVYRLRADQFQLRNKVLALDIQLNDIEAAYNGRVQNRLQEVQKRLREIDVTLPSALELRDIKASLARVYVDRYPSAQEALLQQQRSEPPNEAELTATGSVLPARAITIPSGLGIDGILGLSLILGLGCGIGVALCR